MCSSIYSNLPNSVRHNDPMAVNDLKDITMDYNLYEPMYISVDIRFYTKRKEVGKLLSKCHLDHALYELLQVSEKGKKTHFQILWH